MPKVILFTIFVAILFDISNGRNDTANAIATVVSTRVLTPVQAVLMAALLNILGAFLNTAVAKTIGSGILDPNAITAEVVASALFAGFCWNNLMAAMGLPVSSSHGLIGSLIGAGFAHKGLGILRLSGLKTVFLSLLISPLLGLLIGYLLMKAILFLFGRFAPGTLNRYFAIMQVLSSSFVAFSHGSNDAQKVMGIITLSLFSGGLISSLDVPFWVIVVCALAMGLGTAFGGWKIIKTMGVNILKLEPVHGFAAESAASTIILGASHFGLPVSTTHVISSCILGVGSTQRFSAVRWGIVTKIIMAWIFTLPCCMAAAWLIETVLHTFFTGLIG